MKRLLILSLCVLAVSGRPATAADSPTRPNVVIFYLDDLGYGDPACYGGKLTPTPQIDSLAKHGVRFTDGYVAACVCSPSRVGLMTGRYQQRAPATTPTRAGAGSELAKTETLFPQRLKAADYATAIVGKWHLGSSPEFLPGSRGFDVAFGSVGNLGEGKGPEFYRGTAAAEKPAEAPITSPAYAREACKFIDSQRTRPFFLYLAFNAVHNPNVASEAVLNRLKHRPRREQQYAASLAEADDAIGTVLAKLRDLKLEDNTLIFFLSDNGHSSPHANNDGLRGGKWLLWEGGIRVPFIVQWKGRIPGGRVVNEPVIQLDVLPTALAAAGVEVRPDWQLDGVNLLPLLQGQTDQPQAGGVVLAVRRAVRHSPGGLEAGEAGQGHVAHALQSGGRSGRVRRSERTAAGEGQELVGPLGEVERANAAAALGRPPLGRRGSSASSEAEEEKESELEHENHHPHRSLPVDVRHFAFVVCSAAERRARHGRRSGLGRHRLQRPSRTQDAQPRRRWPRAGCASTASTRRISTARRRAAA